jgi:hypothetical protein
MPSFLRTTAGGKAISGGALQPRGRRGNTAQIASYWAGGLVDDTAFESIATTVVGSGGQGTITFSDIPATFKHLQLRCLARGSTGTLDAQSVMRLNGDSGTNYSYHRIYGSGSSAGSDGAANTTAAMAGINSGASSLANTFAVGIVDILDYANTDKYKTVRTLTGYDQNGQGAVYLWSNSWRSESAVSSITITATANFSQYSSFALYGIKG